LAEDRGLDDGIAGAWPISLALNELGRGATERRIAAEGPALGRIARALDLVELKSLEATLRVSPWLDGAQVEGRWSAVIVQICGVTLEPFETALSGDLAVRAVPSGSPALPSEPDHELELDPDADDPPDEIIDGVLPLGAYVVEDLSLAIDPFPRKPGAEFKAPEGPSEPSPFAVLARLKNSDGESR
jgi:hypothetical protein